MKAVTLLSGGLDSTLATELMHREGVELVAVNFKTPFCQDDRQAATGGCARPSYAQKVAARLGIEFRLIGLGDDYIEIVKKPRHGYGANVNPCIDCKILFFKKAKELMGQIGASFLITGEVLGQRPMSQMRRQLEVIEQESGLAGYVVKPLSAKLLPPTIPEEKGWIVREHLLDISGRTRKPQMALARQYGVTDYPGPAGGCLLTDPGFARKVRDLMKYDELNLFHIPLIKTGRYFRLSGKAKLVVGRDERENTALEALAVEGDYLFRPSYNKGPVALGRGEFNKELLDTAARITARYCDKEGDGLIEISYNKLPDKTEARMNAAVSGEDELVRLRV